MQRSAHLLLLVSAYWVASTSAAAIGDQTTEPHIWFGDLGDPGHYTHGTPLKVAAAETSTDHIWFEGIEDPGYYSTTGPDTRGENDTGIWFQPASERSWDEDWHYVAPGDSHVIKSTKTSEDYADWSDCQKTTYYTDPNAYLKLWCGKYKSDYFKLTVTAGKKVKVFTDTSRKIFAKGPTGEDMTLELKSYPDLDKAMRCKIRAVVDESFSTVQPPSTTQGPDGTTQGPDGTTQGPDGTTQGPDSTTQGPDGTCTCGVPNRGSRIVGGELVKDREFPWLAKLTINTDQGAYWCAGTIISPRHVVTAAHCTKFSATTGADSVDILVGADNLNQATTIRVKTIHNNPDYDTSGYAHDITLLELSEPLQFGDNIRAACMPDTSTTYEGATSVVAGWGTTDSGSVTNSLMKVELPLGGSSDCPSSDQRYMLCHVFTDGKDSCGGDSGGPVVVANSAGKYELAGVVSHGPYPCGKNGPGVNTRVTAYDAWVRKIVAENGDSFCT